MKPMSAARRLPLIMLTVLVAGGLASLAPWLVEPAAAASLQHGQPGIRPVRGRF